MSAHQDPPLIHRSHLQPFKEGIAPWLVIMRNAVPVAGVYLLGWSPAMLMFELWFDGVVGLGIMLALQIHAFSRRDPFPGPSWAGWLIMFAIIGIPYWFTLLYLQGTVWPAGFWSSIEFTRDVWLVLAGLVAANLWYELRRGYHRMTDQMIRIEANWHFSMHLARVAAILTVSFILRGRFLIVILSLALAYIEIYPIRSLRILGGDAILDDTNRTRSPD